VTLSPDSLKRIREQALRGQLRVTAHAHREMVAEAILLDDLLAALSNGEIIEDYPTHQRGACCLIPGRDAAERAAHIVCTTAQPVLIIITAYLPLPPRWITPTQRGARP
jgi:hypothetical protein